MSIPANFVNPAAQAAYVETIPPAITAATAALSANTAYLTRFRVGAPMTVGRMSVYVGVSSGNLDVGVYQSDGTTLTRIAASGSTPVGAGTTEQVVPFVAPAILVPNTDYYAALAADNATFTTPRANALSQLTAIQRRCVTLAASFPLPATIALSGTTASAAIPALVLTP